MRSTEPPLCFSARIANNYFLAFAALIFAHLAVIDAESLALASALILAFFFCGAAEFFPGALCPPASRSNSLSRVCRNVALETPECFVLTPSEVRDLAHNREKDGKTSYWLQPKQYETLQFHDKWDRIGKGSTATLLANEPNA